MANPASQYSDGGDGAEGAMKVLVVGASGALGPHVVGALLERGHQVTGTSRSASKLAGIEGLGAEAVVADILDADQIAAALAAAGPEVVVNVATSIPAAGPRQARDMRPTNRLRREGTANLLAAAEAAGVRRYVSESMMFVYGFGRQREAAEESQAPGRDERSGIQDVIDALVAGESSMREAGETGGIECVSLRFGLFHSPAGDSTREMARMIEKRRLPLVGGGEAIHSWIALEDAAAAVVAAVEAKAPAAAYNVVDDEPVSFADYASEIARLRGAKPPRSVPSWLVRPFASYATAFMADVQLPVSNARLKEELGWEPTRPSYREALAPLADAEL